MKLTSEEATHLIEQISEFVFYGDPLDKETILDSAILAKLVEEYPAETEAIQQRKKEETAREVTEFIKQREEK